MTPHSRKPATDRHYVVALSRANLRIATELPPGVRKERALARAEQKFETLQHAVDWPRLVASIEADMKKLRASMGANYRG